MGRRCRCVWFILSRNFLFTCNVVLHHKWYPSYGYMSSYSVKGHFACPFVEQTQVIFNWSTIKQLCLQHIENSFIEIIIIVQCKRHLMEVLRMSCGKTPIWWKNIQPGEKHWHCVQKTSKQKDHGEKYLEETVNLLNLPYWCKLELWHCIDVMHVKKNYVIVSSRHY